MNAKDRAEARKLILANIEGNPGRNSCWLWAGRTHPTSGGGMTSFQGRDWYAHRLAAIAWGRSDYEPPPDLFVCHHSCHEPRCCNPAHLIWLTPEEHQTHHNKRRGAFVGSANPKSRYSESKAARAKAMRAEGVPVKEIAERLKIPERTAYYLSGPGWSHVKVVGAGENRP